MTLTLGIELLGQLKSFGAKQKWGEWKWWVITDITKTAMTTRATAVLKGQNQHTRFWWSDQPESDNQTHQGTGICFAITYLKCLETLEIEKYSFSLLSSVACCCHCCSVLEYTFEYGCDHWEEEKWFRRNFLKASCFFFSSLFREQRMCFYDTLMRIRF